MAKKRPRVTAAAADARETKVNYCVLEKTNEAAIDTSLERFAKIKPLPRQHDGTHKDKLLVATQWMLTTANKDELAPCDVCQGYVDITMIDRGELPAQCPYCGVGEDVVTDGDVKVVNLEDYKQQRPEPEEEPPVVAEGVEVVDRGQGPQQPETEVDEKSGQKLTRVQRGKQSNLSKVKPSPAALVEASVEVDRLIVESVGNMVRIGRQLHVIHESFNAAKKAAGKDEAIKEVLGGAKSFEDFIRGRWGFHVNTAWRAIKVASEYSDEEIAEYGVHKLAIASRLNKEIDGLGKKLLGEGASKNRMEETLRNVKGGETEDADEGPAAVTCAVPAKRTRIALVDSKGKPAKRLTEELTGELVCGKNVLRFVVRKTKKGAIELCVVPERH